MYFYYLEVVNPMYPGGYAPSGHFNKCLADMRNLKRHINFLKQDQSIKGSNNFLRLKYNDIEKIWPLNSELTTWLEANKVRFPFENEEDRIWWELSKSTNE